MKTTSSLNHLRRVAAVLAAIFGVANVAFAANQYYDTAQANPNPGWSSSGSALDWAAVAGTPPYNNPWTSGNTAVFEGATAGTVTVDAANIPAAGGITFATNSYVLTNGTITLTGTPVIDTGTNNATIHSVLAGGVGVTKKGSGRLTLGFLNSTNLSTYTGGLTISAGEVDAKATNAVGTGTVTLGDANTGSSACILDVDIDKGNFTNAIVVSANGSGTAAIRFNNAGVNGVGLYGGVAMNRDVTLTANSAAMSLRKAISGTGNVTLTSAVGGQIKFLVNNTFAGNVTITSGSTLQLGAFGGTSDAIPDSAMVTNNGTFSLSAVNETIGGLNGTGTLTVNSATSTLTVGAGSVTGCNFGGVIKDNSGTILCKLTKIGTGTQALSGTNTYTGATTVNAGTLLVNNPGSINASAVTVQNAGSTLGGNGGIGSAVTIGSGCVLAPGTNGAVGTLTISNALTLNGSAIILCKLSTVAGSSDQMVLTSPNVLTLFGANTISLATPFGAAPAGTYTLMTFAGGTAGGGTLALDHAYPNATLNVNATSVTLTVTGTGTSSQLLWTGDGVANNWDTSTANWTAVGLGGSTTYADGFSATIDDSGSANPAINIPSTVSPSSVTVNVTNKNYTIGGADISGATDSLTKNGPGTLTLTSANTYGGSTTINGGTLVIGQLGGGTYAPNIVNNGVLNYGSSAAQTLSGVISGSGSLVESGAGGSLTLSGANTYTNTTTVSAGTLYAKNVSAVGTNVVTLGDANTGANDVGFLWSSLGGTIHGVPIVVSANGTGLVTIGANSSIAELFVTNPITLNRDATLQAGGGQFDLIPGGSFTGSGNLTVAGGTFKLRAGLSASYTGNIIIASGGNIQVGAFSGATDVIPDSNSVTIDAGGTLTMSCAGETIGGLNGAGTVSLNSENSTLTVGGGNTSGNFSGTVQDNGVVISLAKTGTGTQVLSGANTYTGNTTIKGGTLQVNSPGYIYGSSAVTVTNAILGGNGSIFAPTTIQTNGTIQPGLGGLDTSSLTVNNNLTLAGNAVFALNRTNTQNATSVTGINTLTYGGTLTVVNVGPALQAGDSFTLFSAAANSGTFAATNLPAGYVWNWNPSTAVLTAVSIIAGPSGPASLTNSVSGSTLNLTWPAGQGWRLVSQTNSLTGGLGATWGTVSGVGDGSAAITIDPTKPTVFYRLVYP